MSRYEQREMKRRRRMYQPLGGLAQRAKGLWEQFRYKRVGVDRRNELIAETHGLLKGHYKEMSAKHDCSRIVQAILKNGTAYMRRDIWLELSGSILALSKDEYAHPVLAKLLRYGGGPAKEGVRAAFRGHAVRAMTHARAAIVLEEGLQRGWSQRGAFELLREAMGHEHRHQARAEAQGGVSSSSSSSSSSASSASSSAAGDSTSAAGVLAQVSPEDREAAGRRASRAMARVVQVQADKKLLGLQMSQRLLDQCLQIAEPAVAQSLVPVCRDAMLALVSSREGGRAACMLAGLGSAKDRKVMARAVSEHIHDVAEHDQGHMLLVRLLAVTDDTKLLQKAILKPAAERLGALTRMLRDAHGRKVFLSVLSPCNRRYFTPKDVLKLKPLQVPKDAPKPKPKPAADSDSGKAGSESGPASGAGASSSELEQQAMAELAADIQDDSATAAAASRANEDAGEAVGAEARELVPASKKQAGVRRGELLDACKVSLADCVQSRAARVLCGEWSWPVALELVRVIRERALRSLGVLKEGALAAAEAAQSSRGPGAGKGGDGKKARSSAGQQEADEVESIREELAQDPPVVKEATARKDLERAGLVLEALADALLLPPPAEGEDEDDDEDEDGASAGKKRSFFGGGDEEDDEGDEDDDEDYDEDEDEAAASGGKKGGQHAEGGASSGVGSSAPSVSSVLEHPVAHKAVRLLLAQDAAVVEAAKAAGADAPKDEDMCLFAPRVLQALGGGDAAGEGLGERLAAHCGTNRGAFTVLGLVEKGSRAGDVAKEALCSAGGSLGALPESAGLRILKGVLGLGPAPGSNGGAGAKGKKSPGGKKGKKSPGDKKGGKN